MSLDRDGWLSWKRVAALWVRIQNYLKNLQWTTNERNGQKTLARQKLYKKIYLVRKDQLHEHFFWAAIDSSHYTLYFFLPLLTLKHLLYSTNKNYNSKQTMSLSMCFLVPQFHTLNCTDKLAT
jgi:hypothetical protein